METEKEKKPDAPTPEQKDYPKPEEKPADNKQTDDNGTAEKQNLDCITTIAKWMEQDNVPRKKAEVNDGGTHTNFRPSEW